MRRKALLPLPLVLVAIAAFAPASEAQDGAVPPGNSQIDQYIETAPSAGGNNSTDGSGGAGPGGAGGAGAEGAGGADVAEEAPEGASAAGGYLSPKELEELGKHGGDGQKAADLAAATAPERPKPDAASGEADAAALSGEPSRDSLGVLLPVILAATVVAAAGFLLYRRFRQPRVERA